MLCRIYILLCASICLASSHQKAYASHDSEKKVGIKKRKKAPDLDSSKKRKVSNSDIRFFYDLPEDGISTIYDFLCGANKCVLHHVARTKDGATASWMVPQDSAQSFLTLVNQLSFTINNRGKIHTITDNKNITWHPEDGYCVTVVDNEEDAKHVQQRYQCRAQNGLHGGREYILENMNSRKSIVLESPDPKAPLWGIQESRIFKRLAVSPTQATVIGAWCPTGKNFFVHDAGVWDGNSGKLLSNKSLWDEAPSTYGCQVTDVSLSLDGTRGIVNISAGCGRLFPGWFARCYAFTRYKNSVDWQRALACKGKITCKQDDAGKTIAIIGDHGCILFNSDLAVYSIIPWRKEHSTPVPHFNIKHYAGALSPDGSWLAMGGIPSCCTPHQRQSPLELLHLASVDLSKFSFEHVDFIYSMLRLHTLAVQAALAQERYAQKVRTLRVITRENYHVDEPTDDDLPEKCDTVNRPIIAIYPGTKAYKAWTSLPTEIRSIMQRTLPQFLVFKKSQE